MQSTSIKKAKKAKAKANPKHRASLTEVQIRYIIDISKITLSKTSTNANIPYELIAYLAPLLTKIENGKKPDFIPATKPNHMAMIGELGEIPAPRLHKEERWSLAYAKYKLDPISCTLVEIADAKEHMYLNDLMSKTEVTVFESAITTQREDI